MTDTKSSVELPTKRSKPSNGGKSVYSPLSNISNHGTTDLDDLDDLTDELDEQIPRDSVINFELSDDIHATQVDIDQSSYIGMLTHLWATITFSWMKPLLNLGNQRPLEPSDLPDLDDSDSSIVSLTLGCHYIAYICLYGFVYLL